MGSFPRRLPETGVSRAEKAGTMAEPAAAIAACHHGSRLAASDHHDWEQKASLPHPRSAQYMRARKQQFPNSISNNAESRMSDAKLILNAAAQGEASAADALLSLVYDELRKLAANRMANEAAGHTLQPTALVHVSNN